MILVVADTGPIRYLVVLEAITILSRLYDRVILPGAVIAELTHRRAPAPVREWASNLPPWAEVRYASTTFAIETLDPGEAEAIALAQELNAHLLLLDEKEGRQEARRRGLLVAGTVGVLEKAAEQDLIDLEVSLERLSRMNFRIDPALIQAALRLQAARRTG